MHEGRQGGLDQALCLQEYLAIGEAPDQIRNCYQQRSRWCKARIAAARRRNICTLRSHACMQNAYAPWAAQWVLGLLPFTACDPSAHGWTLCAAAGAAAQGHFQIMFNRQHCPLFQSKLSLWMRILYSSAPLCPPFHHAVQ